MSECIHGWTVDKGDGVRSGAAAVDQRLTWLRPLALNLSQGSGQWQPALEQELVDFHARYERACIED